MRCPAKKRLVETFKISAADATCLRQVCDAVEGDEESFIDRVNAYFPAVAIKHDRVAFSTRQNRVRIALECFDFVMDSQGVHYEEKNNIFIGGFLQMRDSYDATICFHALTNTFYISDAETFLKG